MALSKQFVLLAALVVMFLGSAHAWCKDGYKDCDYNPKNGCETYVKGNDINNCGDCKQKCYAPKYAVAKCKYGKCEFECQSGWGNCDNNWKNGCETDLNKDYNNCGSCGNKCKQPKYYGGETVCSGGKCVEQCKKGMKWNDKKKCCA
jgi:hypothetical protein